MTVDNTECEVDCTNINFAVVQTINFTIKGHHFGNRTDMVKVGKTGPLAKAKMEEPMELNLSKIRNQVPAERNKHGSMKPYSPEDKFMMEGV